MLDFKAYFWNSDVYINEKNKNNPVWQTYNRAYKAHYARYMKKKITVSEFEEWSRFASEFGIGH